MSRYHRWQTWPSLTISIHLAPWHWRLATLEREGPWGDEFGSWELSVLFLSVRFVA